MHVDHGLRPGSAAEAEVVEAAAARFGAAFRAERVAVEPGPNLEARARAARFGGAPARRRSPATPPTTRPRRCCSTCSGAQGSTAWPACGPSAHPILGLRRAETRALCVDARADAGRRPEQPRPRPPPQPGAPRAAPAARRRSPGATWPGCWPARPALLAEDADLLDELAGRLDVTDARVLAAAPVPLGAPRLAAVARRPVPTRRRVGRPGPGRGARRGRGLPAPRRAAGGALRRPPPGDRRLTRRRRAAGGLRAPRRPAGTLARCPAIGPSSATCPSSVT